MDGASGALAMPDDALIIVPVRNMVLFPGMILPITIGRDSSIAGTQQAVKAERPIGIVLQRNTEIDRPGLEDLSLVGTRANVLRYVTTPDGTHHIICQGQQRFRVVELLEGYPFLVARVAGIEEADATGTEIEARFMQLKERALEVLQLTPQASQELVGAVQNIGSAAALADMVAGLMDIKAPEKQKLLEAVDLQKRLDGVLELLAQRLEVLRLSRQIDERTKASMDERQREYLLREQLKSIQKELGEGEEGNAAELVELRQAIADAQMPEEVHKQAAKELKRLERMSDASAEYSMIRTYLDWLIEVPWKAPEASAIDIAGARRILGEDHFGLEMVKKRILEFLAVRKLNPDGHGPILCFVGPPGVGKTSLGQSIAKALARKFVRLSLGGVHDEAEIRGHRRTYIGALPGNIIQALKKAGTRGCVMMLDEIDKVGAGIHGDPSSALLEVLDPEQNATFRDNYLAVPFDLSRVLFITTANVLDTIPGPLRDRMEIVHLPGYTQEEKLEIARRYLVRRQLADNGLKPEQLEISDAALSAIIRDYTREAGVRGLEREIGAVCRRIAVKIADGEASKARIDEGDLADILGPAKFENELALRTGMPGVATGLAWTPVGGDILFIEASKHAGGGKLILTGQLGDVMKESAQAALTLVKSRAASLGIDTAAFERSDVHVHVPAGAIPKDGPSAGVAMFIALASLFTDRKVRTDTAMTGEISLRGLVLPVGGIKEKVLAAMRAGISRVMLPARNRKDLEEVPAEAKQKLEFVFLEDADDAVRMAIEPAGEIAPQISPAAA
ncbi:MAG: endopeptidase La [Betaproteobacteria bacterium RIFCSPLOWO2_12_FULL_62_13b]|nr:MAG: endopeptidase La [Betaproteobacteria bacterium RIFCSPLOWO2_12_FULL_62_13b]